MLGVGENIPHPIWCTFGVTEQDWTAVMRHPLLPLRLLVVFLIGAPAVAGAANPTFFTDSSTFNATLGSSVTDSYTNSSYSFINTNAAMSAVLGETDYTSTGFSNHNIVQSNGSYCAGCNGSFQLGFTTTSVGTSSGVAGVGLNIGGNSSTVPYYAFISYGDGSTQNVALPIGASFFGVTAATAPCRGPKAAPDTACSCSACSG